MPKKSRKSNNVVIEDKLLDPFYLVKDEYSVSLRSKVKSNDGKFYKKNWGHFNNFTDALKAYLKYASIPYEKIKSINQYQEIQEEILKKTEILLNKYIK